MTEKTFLEILSEKIEKQIRSELSHSEKTSNFQTTEEKNEAPLTGIVDIPLGKFYFQPPREQIFGKIYPRANPRPQRPIERKKHSLSETQKQAVVYFWGWQIRLQEDFTMPELKKAFRTLAHKLHPDKNEKTSQAYLELQAHYHCLLSVFKTTSQA